MTTATAGPAIPEVNTLPMQQFNQTSPVGRHRSSTIAGRTGRPRTSGPTRLGSGLHSETLTPSEQNDWASKILGANSPC